MEVRFSVDALPVGQPRPRATTVNGAARMYEAKKSHPIHDFKASCRVACRAAYGGAPLAAPLSVALVCVFPRTQQQLRLRSPPGRMRHAKKPDIDNVIKAVQDALNGLLFVDDAQICVTSASKWIAAKDEPPHVEVTVRPLE